MLNRQNSHLITNITLTTTSSFSTLHNHIISTVILDNHSTSCHGPTVIINFVVVYENAHITHTHIPSSVLSTSHHNWAVESVGKEGTLHPSLIKMLKKYSIVHGNLHYSVTRHPVSEIANVLKFILGKIYELRKA